MSRPIFWEHDSAIDALCRRPEWCNLLRAASRAGIGFKTVHPSPRVAARYGCDAVRVEKVGEGRYREKLIAQGDGDDPVEALLAAFDQVDGLDPSLAAGLRPAPDILAELLGDPVADLVG